MTDQDEVQSMLRPSPAKTFAHYPVGTAVRGIRNDRPRLIEPESGANEGVSWSAQPTNSVFATSAPSSSHPSGTK
jgi:hypothetical protein